MNNERPLRLKKYFKEARKRCKGSHTEVAEQSAVLTDLEAKDVIGADGLAAVLEELLDVNWDGEPLELGAALRELAHPLR